MQYFRHDALKQFKFFEVGGGGGGSGMYFFLEEICDFGLFDTKIKHNMIPADRVSLPSLKYTKVPIKTLFSTPQNIWN